MSGRYRPAENSLLTKHVVAAGTFAKDAGSTPAASTILNITRKARVRARWGVTRVSQDAKDVTHGDFYMG